MTAKNLSPLPLPAPSPGPATGPVAVPAGATNRQDSGSRADAALEHCGEQATMEAGSISEDQLANLEKCRPEVRVDVGDRVVLRDGRTGTVVDEYRSFDVEIDGSGQVHFLNEDFVHAMGESADTRDAGSIAVGEEA